MLKHFHQKYVILNNYNVSESHSNTIVHQSEAINPFSLYIVIPQYFYLNTMVKYLLILPTPSLVLYEK